MCFLRVETNFPLRLIFFTESMFFSHIVGKKKHVFENEMQFTTQTLAEPKLRFSGIVMQMLKTGECNELIYAYIFSKFEQKILKICKYRQNFRNFHFLKNFWILILGTKISFLQRSKWIFISFGMLLSILKQNFCQSSSQF